MIPSLFENSCTQPSSRHVFNSITTRFVQRCYFRKLHVFVSWFCYWFCCSFVVAQKTFLTCNKVASQMPLLSLFRPSFLPITFPLPLPSSSHTDKDTVSAPCERARSLVLKSLFFLISSDIFNRWI